MARNCEYNGFALEVCVGFDGNNFRPDKRIRAQDSYSAACRIVDDWFARNLR